jgi:hypothetical protein
MGPSQFWDKVLWTEAIGGTSVPKSTAFDYLFQSNIVSFLASFAELIVAL